ncbi:unnamed protein product [Lymnaea stagnalis]|uniref:Uncharacterized protein n=1 Tax=Lymnaea stagnalis TaxID=6523 RepID=A0AAV2I0Z1_LYMST
MNLTYSHDLSDQRTAAFQYHAHLFCEDMKAFYYKSFLAERFFECGVDSFSDNPVKIHFYTVFHGTSLDGLVDSTVPLIRRFAQPVYYLTYLTYLVGDVLVLPEDAPVHPSVYPINITLLPTSTAHADASTTEVVTTSMTSLIIDDYGIMLILYYEVHNLTYTDDLRDPKSKDFRRHKEAVCDDLLRWYTGQDSPFLAIYRACDVTSFNPSPTGVTFTLLFETKLHGDFSRQVRTFLEYKAPKAYAPGLNLLDVGHLYLIMDRYRIEISSTILPSHTMSTPTMTMPSITSTTIAMDSTTFIVSSTVATLTMSSSSITVNEVSVLSYEFGLADFYYTNELANKNSARFEYLQERFCRDVSVDTK